MHKSDEWAVAFRKSEEGIPWDQFVTKLSDFARQHGYKVQQSGPWPNMAASGLTQEIYRVFVEAVIEEVPAKASQLIEERSRFDEPRA